MRDCRNVKCTADVTTSSATVILLFHNAILNQFLTMSTNLQFVYPMYPIKFALLSGRDVPNHRKRRYKMDLVESENKVVWKYNMNVI